ncbi:peptidase S10 serine carboxypeptidase [Ramaria rubella]|nr:peptidase S10 serine carboxypeptidase [Ramaria rubella]
MRSLVIFSSLLAVALAAPPVDLVFSEYSAGQKVLTGPSEFKETTDISNKIESWLGDGNQFVEDQGITYQRTSHPALTDTYQLRVKSNSSTLCDSTVKQQSGYLDIDDNRHLFFWFFESRHSPETSPLVLWLNGGPGCSSSTGLLFELGPCRVSDEGQSTVYNNHSWNKHANIIFLDQPINVGYSYSTDGSSVSTSPVAALDVWSFLELFLIQFPEYSKLPFHIAAESYGGTFAPNIASVIHKKNKELAIAPVPTLKHINLASIILANGLTEPSTQFASVPDYACDGPYPVWDDPKGPECQALRSKVPTCQRLVEACYSWESRLTCVPAQLYCWSQLYGSFQQLGLNPYDVRRTCDREKDGALCYKQMLWIDTYLNKPQVKKELGATSSPKFESCNMEINQGFSMQGDGMHNSAALLPPLLEDGVRLLVYAGNADFMCNFIGNLNWMIKLENPFHAEFSKASNTPWITLDGGKAAGEVRSAGGGGFGAGNYTYVSVHKAGHMVPYDQPEAALDLFTRWITDTPLTSAPNSSNVI